MNRLYIKKTKLIAISMLLVFIMCSCSMGKKSIDLSKYITVDFEGYNGYAKPVITIDKD